MYSDDDNLQKIDRSIACNLRHALNLGSLSSMKDY